MAQVRHIVTAPGKDPVEFFAPEGANDGQLQRLASQALSQAFAGESFVTPVLDDATRKSLERAPRQLTQDEILASQGDLTAPEENIRTRTADALTSVLSGLGMSNAAEKGRGFTDDLYDWTPAAALESGEEAIGDFAGGRYGEALGNAALSALDIVPELGTAVKGGSALAMFLGRNAKTANLDALRQAEQMAEQGADRRQIWDETGWFQGTDGQWRFEISDRGLKVKDPPSGKKAGNAAANAMAKQLGYKDAKSVPYLDAGAQTSVRRAGIEGWNSVINGVPLRDVVSHPELEAAYPERFAAMTATPLTGGGKTVGQFLPGQDQLRWKTGGRTAEEKRSTVAHEMQHGMVQFPEGFSGGAQAGSAGSVEAGPFYEGAIQQRDHIQRMLDDPNVSDISKIQLRRMLPQAEKQIQEAAQYEGYRRVAGEVEARNVQKRLNFSDEMRRQIPPWATQDVPDEDQFVVFKGDGPQMSLDDPGPISADPPGTVPVPNALTGATPKSAGIKGGRQAAMTKVWEGVDNLDDALKIANAGGHHRLDAGGKLMGSPDVSPEDLPAWRGGIDAMLQRAGGRGLGWYQGVRDLTAEIASTPALQSTFSRVGGVYSPQAAPVAETGFNLAHHNRRVLTGEPQTITTGQRGKAAEQAYGAVDPETGYINLTPEKISLGEKTEPYSVLKDPTRDWGWTAPADLWMGRVFGYKPDKGQKAFDRAFQPNEHAFIKGEMALALERARAAGTLPPDATVANVQEVLWVQKRFEDYMAENPGATIEEAEKYAKEAIGEGVERHTAALSREYTPGGGLGELEQIAADPAANARFAAGMEASGGGRNSVFDAMQMYQRPTVNALGFWNDPVHGLQTNPAFVDRPLVSFRPEPVMMEKGKNAGQMIPKGPAMDAESRNAMMVAGRLFGLENVQHGVGANIFIPQVSTHAPQQLNGAFYPPARRAEAIEAATKAGLDVVDQGNGGVYVTSFADDTAGAAKKVRAFADANPGGELGRYDTNYASSGLSEWDEDFNLVPRPHGEGIATRELLEATGSIPGLEKRLENSAYPGQVAERNEERARWAKDLATSLRPDVQKLRDLLAQGGPAAVRRYVDKHGYKGLPVWAGAILGGGLLVSQQQDQGAASYPQGI